MRGKKGVDLAALEALLVRFSEMIVENRWIKECDINPLLASPEGFVALDARIVLFGRLSARMSSLKLAIRPYPVEYVEKWALKKWYARTFKAYYARR